MRGKSGRQKGAENIELVRAWIYERNTKRDWSGYEKNNRINRAKLSTDLGFSYSVCTQNDTVRNLLKSADELWFGCKENKSSKEDDKNACNQVSTIDSSKKECLICCSSDLEAENRELKRKLLAHEQLKCLIESGAPGFKL